MLFLKNSKNCWEGLTYYLQNFFIIPKIATDATFRKDIKLISHVEAHYNLVVEPYPAVERRRFGGCKTELVQIFSLVLICTCEYENAQNRCACKSWNKTLRIGDFSEHSYFLYLLIVTCNFCFVYTLWYLQWLLSRIFLLIIIN